MASLNRVLIIGNLGRDPEMKTDALAVCSVATTERWLDKQSDEWKSKTEWHNLKAWRYAAEKLMRCEKGWTVYVEGKIVTDKWTDQEGNDKERVSIDVQDVKVVAKPQAAAKVDADDEMPF